MELAAVEIRPETFPQAEHVCPFELTLVPDKKHAEEKEEVGGICGLKMKVECGVHQLDKVVESQQLVSHA